MRILIVDDEEKIRLVLSEYARFEGFEVDEAGDGLEAINKCRQCEYDLIIMDIMMPKVDGFSAIKEIKKFSDVPVLMLSARSEELDKLYSFELGVDDYVVKPFSSKEVMARIHAILKRKNKAPAETEEIFNAEGLKIDFKGRNVYVDGEKIYLTPKLYDLLFYLVNNKGVALSRKKLLADVWGFDSYGDDRTVDTHIKTLRGSLKEYRKFIYTVRGLGYKFEV
ncbi:MAG: response regulator transcription factor [Clostridia bacterium]|nr:response regulator transcription factor [Clostridia bacterium]